jgi:hypothetical protein
MNCGFESYRDDRRALSVKGMNKIDVAAIERARRG